MEPKIPADDQQRIEELVAAFRGRIENMYRMGYLQGRIYSEERARDALKAKVASLSA